MTMLTIYITQKLFNRKVGQIILLRPRSNGVTNVLEVEFFINSGLFVTNWLIHCFSHKSKFYTHSLPDVKQYCKT